MLVSYSNMGLNKLSIMDLLAKQRNHMDILQIYCYNVDDNNKKTTSSFFFTIKVYTRKKNTSDRLQNEQNVFS